MRLRSLMTCVLLCAVVFAPVAAAQEDADAGEDVASESSPEERELSPEEESEAKELAVRLMKRLRETGDFGPVVSEFVVDDFAERLRKLARAEQPESEIFFVCEREVILRAGDEDLRRVYVALLNFWHWQELLGDAAWNYVKVEYKIDGRDALQDDGAWGRRRELQKAAIPREALRVAEGEPLLDAFMRFVRRDDDDPEAETEEEVEAQQAKIRAAVVRDAARLRDFTDKLERCVALLREGAESLRSDLKSLAAAHVVSDNPDDYGPRPGDPFHVYHLEGDTLRDDAFGLPEGTFLIRARIRPYEIAMARLDGRLQVLGVYPDFDGD